MTSSYHSLLQTLHVHYTVYMYENWRDLEYKLELKDFKYYIKN